VSDEIPNSEADTGFVVIGHQRHCQFLRARGTPLDTALMAPLARQEDEKVNRHQDGANRCRQSAVPEKVCHELNRLRVLEHGQPNQRHDDRERVDGQPEDDEDRPRER